MSDPIKHECGIALIRLLKPLSYYKEKYGDLHYGLNKMYLLMEKQHNRGQDGAGLATIKLDTAPGKSYFDRERSVDKQAIKAIFDKVFQPFNTLADKEKDRLKDMDYVKNNFPFMGELLLGHLRYGTHGGNDMSNCHPRIRANNWKTRTLIVAGNFNMTNVDELFDRLVSLGQFPREMSDTMTVLEKIGHFLDANNQRLFKKFKTSGLSNADITPLIEQEINVADVLRNAAEDFDGGYAMAGMIGHGDAFVMRDPNGIRPAFFYKDDEVVVVASERPAIQTAFNVHRSKVQEIKPGHALIIKKDGSVGEVECTKPLERKACSFERIYFSRGSDFEIYQERKMLGKLLVPTILKAVNHDLQNTVFSYIPNTAEVAFLGMTEEVQKQHIELKLQAFNRGEIKSTEELMTQLAIMPRVEKIAVKDVKMRTFITEDTSRNDLVHHVYDVTYGLVKNNVDTLVVLDDSIVRGTTLKESILTMLDRLQPKKIIVVSSAPQIRYPDCYGIDMSKMGSFVAFQAAVQLWKKKDDTFLPSLYKRCKEELEKPITEIENLVKEVYAPFSDEEISTEIANIVRPQHIFSDVQVIYQTIDNLHLACPNNQGDWYFTGNYPTAGGNRVTLNAFINYMEGKNVRAY
ncbi:MAG TPA: amidophosphoribosyltransferase [Chitinophagales bacterium]|nr:amidophosphoribosyltransferase [Chitinophagales bacterium]HMW12301.1 amidophosphoribosyltransferase [Chitinophagales bacterium]HMX58977.1 amidophosphoribosyltransferase [Chitinophagales bacterium]HMY24400.1 amidophosphoribosyltransferase [Chitinophagales bacterium]HMZ32908.1 amidophosphoribosyltransferase [Chitinophagales bacterium]